LSKNDVIKHLREKISLKKVQFPKSQNLNPRSKFILKILFFIQFKTNWSKIKV